MESAWLGVEAIPGGLADIRGMMEANAKGLLYKRQPPVRAPRDTTWMARAGQWMKKVTRLS